jgi:intracellular septation protein A
VCRKQVYYHVHSRRICLQALQRAKRMMNTPDRESNEKPAHKQRPLVDLLISILIPSVVLMKFSGDEYLGATSALILALAFPVCWGLFELFKFNKLNYFALLGLVSVGVTGGIGLLQLDQQWIAVKEAAIPGLIGLGVLGSTWTRYPLIKTLLYNPSTLDVGKIQRKLDETRNSALFDARLLNATYFLSGAFFFSSLMNYILAAWIVTSPTGSAAFNEELGRLTLLSYPVIAIPSMLMMMAVLYYLWRTIHGLTGLSMEEIFATANTKALGRNP